MRDSYEVRVHKTQDRDHVEYVAIDWKKTLNWIYEKCGMKFSFSRKTIHHGVSWLLG
jgi:hypothetical protein